MMNIEINGIMASLDYVVVTSTITCLSKNIMSSMINSLSTDFFYQFCQIIRPFFLSRQVAVSAPLIVLLPNKIQCLAIAWVKTLPAWFDRFKLCIICFYGILCKPDFIHVFSWQEMDIVECWEPVSMAIQIWGCWWDRVLLTIGPKWWIASGTLWNLISIKTCFCGYSYC